MNDFQLLNLRQVRACYGNKSRTWVYEAAGRGLIPKPCRLGASLAWSAAEVQADIEKKLAENRFTVKPRHTPKKPRSATQVSEPRAA